MDPDARVHRYREQAWPWPLYAFGIFVVAFMLVIGHGAELIVAAACLAPMVWNLITRRKVEISPAGLKIQRLALAWSDIEDTQFREVPIARAGMFVRLTDEARQRLGLPPPKISEQGFGLEPIPEERAAVRHDFFLKAYRAQLEAWFALVNLHRLKQVGEQLHAIAEQLSAPRCRATLVMPEPAMTIALEAETIDDLVADAQRAIAAVLPEDARWNPTYSGKLMLLVGKLALSRDPAAEACLESLKTAARAAVAGKLDVMAMFAERK